MSHSKTKLVICPYCGETQPAEDRCRTCRGLFEPLSRQATHNAMGPWSVRDPARPFHPGCSYETLVRMVERAQVTKLAIIRGPTTKQFWTVARRVPGIAHLLGYCHSCDAQVDPDAHGCPECGAPFGAYLDRNYLGLPEVKPLPWEAPDDGADRGASSGPAWAGGHGGASRGISSFASDEELLGYHGHRSAVRPAVGHGNGSGEHTLEPPEDPELHRRAEATAATAATMAVGGEGDDWLARPAVRAMQRRIARQQRTIRVLTVIAVVIALGGALFNLMTVAAMKRDGTQTPPARSGSGGSPEGEAPSRPTGGEASDPTGAGADAPAPLGRDEPALEAVDDDIEAPAVGGNVSAGSSAEHQRALSLIERSADPARSLSDRIADLEEAVAILDNIARVVDPGEQPGDLPKQLEAAREALERLRLEDL